MFLCSAAGDGDDQKPLKYKTAEETRTIIVTREINECSKKKKNIVNIMNIDQYFDKYICFVSRSVSLIERSHCLQKNSYTFSILIKIPCCSNSHFFV